jgi:hypothetical protein
MKVRRPIGKTAFHANRARAGDLFARSRALRLFSSGRKKHAAVDVLFEKEGSLSCGRTATSNKKTSTMFLSKRRCFFVILFSEHEILLLLANKT